MAGLFQVLYGKADGTFGNAEVLKGTDGEPLIIPADDKDQLTEKICTRPFAADWDGDGHLDLVVGNFSGTFYWFKGEGKGKFRPKPEQIKSGGKPLKIGGVHSDPFIVDWDGDGDLDLITGSSDGGVYWAENKAGKGKMPDLGPIRALIDPPPKWGAPSEPMKPLRESDLTRPTYATRVWVDDINGDGKLDLLVGDSVTLVSPAKGLTDEEMTKKYAEWQEEFKKAQAAISAIPVKNAKDGKDDKDTKEKEEQRKKAYEEFNKVYQKRSEFMTEEMTGFVWLYLRK
ncbi:MAG TPA: VCBS repeat-containing protein [Gemmata sp.]|nr:VCBS repeat-containing protein [Gemmata sp.]